MQFCSLPRSFVGPTPACLHGHLRQLCGVRAFPAVFISCKASIVPQTAPSSNVSSCHGHMLARAYRYNITKAEVARGCGPFGLGLGLGVVHTKFTATSSSKGDGLSGVPGIQSYPQHSRLQVPSVAHYTEASAFIVSSSNSLHCARPTPLFDV